MSYTIRAVKSGEYIGEINFSGTQGRTSRIFDVLDASHFKGVDSGTGGVKTYTKKQIGNKSKNPMLRISEKQFLAYVDSEMQPDDIVQITFS